VYRWLCWYGHDDTDDFIDFDDDDGSDGDKDDHDDDYCYFLLLILTATMYTKFLDVSLDKLLTNYEVLVSSPGISNTLTTNRDFETFKVQYVLTVLCLFLFLDQWWYNYDYYDNIAFSNMIYCLLVKLTMMMTMISSIIIITLEKSYHNGLLSFVRVLVLLSRQTQFIARKPNSKER